MKAARTMLDAQTLLPSIRPARRNQSASNSSAAAPDRKKARLSGIVGVMNSLLLALHLTLFLGLAVACNSTRSSNDAAGTGGSGGTTGAAGVNGRGGTTGGAGVNGAGGTSGAAG